MNILKTSILVRTLIIILILILTFWLGMTVGYHKAEFSYRFSDNYFRAFGMHGPIPGGIMGIKDTDDLVGGHGAVGKVISVKMPTLIVSDRDGIEKNIIINNDTVIRSARSTTASTTIKNDDFIVIIGTPNENGSITAKLIRIMPPINNMSSTTLPNGFNNGRGPGMMYNQQTY